MPLGSIRRRRAALWILLATGFLFVNFHRTATAVLADSLARTFDATGAELGLLHASFFYVYAPLQLPAGLIVDRYGPRRVGTAGLGLLTLGVVGFAASETLPAAFLARGIVGLGGSVLYIGTLRFCAAWFRADQFATMTGYTIGAAGLGGILATTPLALAIGAVGWRSTMIVAAATTGVLTLAIAAFVRDTPTSAGFDAVGHGGDGADTASLAEVGANVRTVVAERETWLMGLILFCVIGVNFTVLGLWGVPFLADTYGISLARASTFVLAGNLGFVLGSPLLGMVSDRFGRRTELIAGAALLFTLAYATLVLVPPLWIVGPIFFLALLTNGGVSLVFTVGKERHAPSVAGTITGVVNGVGYLGAATLPAVLGGILDVYWTGEMLNGARVYTVAGYRVAFGIAAAAGLVATLAALYLHRREGGTGPTPASSQPR
ncbi:MFS transporter [Haloplanus pelagicus]|uniref:MFS transporter n=1 Tax=Haloplanus pelagicus TaxID=2949995 RepID=UPI00203DF979|nr:MFS transporter [Haloplanus sp. HW8-1]